MNPHDRYLKKDGKEIKKIYISFFSYSEYPQSCDCCDDKKNCAVLNILDYMYTSICEDCLRTFADAFKEGDVKQ